MASNTYKARFVVLKKTKLGEKDLIVTALDSSGALMQCVAKGARKPGGSFAARLELFSTVDALLARGRSLDVVCEARLVDTMTIAGADLERCSCAAPVAELLGLVAQPDFEQTRLFDMARAAFLHIADPAYDGVALLALTAAALWKVVAQAGFRPSFTTCVACGRPVQLNGERPTVPLSFADGGITCDACPKPADAVLVDEALLRWCEALLMMTFDEVALSSIDERTVFSVLQLVRQWVRTHTNRNLKSLDFLFTAGLFQT